MSTLKQCWQLGDRRQTGKTGMGILLAALQLPHHMEGDIGSPAAYCQRWRDVTLERIAYHKHLRGRDLQMTTERLTLSLTLGRHYLYMIEKRKEGGTNHLVLLLKELTLSECYQPTMGGYWLPLGAQGGERIYHAGERGSWHLRKVLAHGMETGERITIDGIVTYP